MIKIFNSDNSDIGYIKTQHCQIMTAITCIILKFESMTKKPIMENPTLFTFVAFGKINSFAYISSIVIQHL